jgi:PadR family transcriptional regulator PadR
MPFFENWYIFNIQKWMISRMLLSCVLMRRSDLGEFEEIVLLSIAVLSPKAYAVVVAEMLEQETKYPVSTGAVHAALQRLEDKGYVSSALGDATPERGGRRKRLFTITAYGLRIVSEARALRNKLWERIQLDAL